MPTPERRPAPKRGPQAAQAPAKKGKPPQDLPPTKGLISEEDKRLLVAGARAAATGDRARLQGQTKTASAPKSRETELQEQVVVLKAKLVKIKGIAVSMNSRSARISQVPGHVMKDYSDQIIKEINRG